MVKTATPGNSAPWPPVVTKVETRWNWLGPVRTPRRVVQSSALRAYFHLSRRCREPMLEVLK